MIHQLERSWSIKSREISTQQRMMDCETIKGRKRTVCNQKIAKGKSSELAVKYEKRSSAKKQNICNRVGTAKVRLVRKKGYEL